MKRSRLDRRTPLKARSTLKSSSLERRSKLPSIGRRRKREQPAINAAYAKLYERSGGRCEAKTVHCTGVADDPHHIAPRSVRPDLIAELSNLLHVCRRCHQHIDANPAWARAAGLHKFSTD